MKEYLFREYELNEKYHDTKENRAWLACALFFTYSLVLLKWILSPVNQGIISENACLFVVMVFLVDLASFLFVFSQIQRKASSVRKSANLKHSIVSQYGAADAKTWSIVVWKNEIASAENLKGIYPDWLNLYRIELPLLFLIILLWIAKTYFILTISCSRLNNFISLSYLQVIIFGAIASIVGVFIGLLLHHVINKRRMNITSTKILKNHE
jgi:uncharacterized membrane protein YhdT